MTNLSVQDRLQLVLALNIAIAHENDVLLRLEADEEFRSFRGAFRDAIQERHAQIEKFEGIREKLKRREPGIKGAQDSEVP
jgi:hypothetical protein